MVKASKKSSRLASEGRVFYGESKDQCEKTFVSLIIKGENLNPSQVTQQLKIKPFEFFAKGDLFEVSGRTLKRGTGLWRVTTQDRTSSTDSAVHLNRILKKLKGKERPIKNFRKQGLEIYLSIFWLSKQGHGGPVLAHEQIKKLARLAIDIKYDIYFN